MNECIVIVIVIVLNVNVNEEIYAIPKKIIISQYQYINYYLR